MAAEASADFYDAGGNAVADVGNANLVSEPSGNAHEPSEQSTGDNNPSEWSSFGRDGHSGSGFSDPDTAAPAPGNGGDADAPYGRFANGKPRKRAARGSKSSNGNSKRSPAQEAIPLASLLYSTHFLASKILVPELELTEDEAKTMGRALSEVGQYYDVPMVSPQQIAWYNLATTAAMIYGSRFIAYRNRSRKEAAEKRAGNVSQMRPLQVGVM